MVNTEKFISQAITEIKTVAGNEKVVMALSGGVDSSVCAALAARAIGENLIPIYIDTGLMRKGETERVRTLFGDISLQVVDAGDEFLIISGHGRHAGEWRTQFLRLALIRLARTA